MSAQPGFFLSVPVDDSVNPIITRLPDAITLAEAREDATEAGHIAFVAAGYETMDMCYATLYQIAPNGGARTLGVLRDLRAGRDLNS